MSAAGQFRRCLQEADVAALRGLWAMAMPHLPQPADDAAAETVMHRARTEADCVPLNGRRWSHAWLMERGLPSGLPDRLRPAPEQVCPRFVETVGVSLNFRSDWMKPAKPILACRVADAIEDIYADTSAPEPVRVRARIDEVRADEMRRLFGRAAQ
jgi:hypothetical protein